MVALVVFYFYLTVGDWDSSLGPRFNFSDLGNVFRRWEMERHFDNGDPSVREMSSYLSGDSTEEFPGWNNGIF